MQGGTERVAYEQAVGLSGLGHEVTLVAAHGSEKRPDYRLVEIGGGDTVTGTLQAKDPISNFQFPNKTTEITESSRNLRKEAVYWAGVEHFLLEHGSEYDEILNNMRGGESIYLPLVSSKGKQMLNVMHLPVFPELAEVFKKFNCPVVTISNAQRNGYPGVRYAGTVYNSVDANAFPFSDVHGSYLLMMGSVVPHKNQKEGIEAAKRLGLKLIIAGKIGSKEYYEREIAPHVDGDRVKLVGEIGFEEKAELLKNARALLFPIIWEEPFGLVMIEAMATGTPVVAYGNGAIPEVVADGETGFICEQMKPVQSSKFKIQSWGIEGLIEGVKRIEEIDRKKCRERVEQEFSVAKMVKGYEKALLDVVEGRV